MRWLPSLGAALNLYLTINLTLLVVQSAGFELLSRQSQGSGSKRRLREFLRPAPARGSSDIVSLEDAPDHPQTGRKAVRLGEMLRNGLPVPGGFVITHELVAKIRLD